MTEIKWGPTGEAVYKRTYARKKTDGTMETWPETVERVVDGNIALKPEGVFDYERDTLIELMTSFKILPGGRHLWASGVPGSYIQNCFVSSLKDGLAKHQDFSFYKLMRGGGVGCNYSRRFSGKARVIHPDAIPQEIHCVIDPSHPDAALMEPLHSTKYSHEWDRAYKIEDSARGWVDAMCDMITNLVDRKPKYPNRAYDFSGVRAEGCPLRTFGGVASGPTPLAKAMIDVAAVINAAITEKRELTAIDLMKIDHIIACCVVAGGVRRSARLALLHWDEPEIDEFLACKQGTDAHWTANISVAIDTEFIQLLSQDGERAELAQRVYKAVCDGMVSNGEPGLWNYDLHSEQNSLVEASNPCLPGWVKLKTPQGYVLMENIKVGDIVWSEDGWVEVLKKWDRGPKEVVAYCFGTESLTATPNHKIVSMGKKMPIGEASSIDWFGWGSSQKPEYTLGLRKTLPAGTVDVYDIMVSGEHHTFWCDGFNVSNCGEISLNAKEACVLGHVNLAAFDMSTDYVNLMMAHYWMARFLYRATFAPCEDAEQEAITKRNRRIGLGHIGVATFAARNGIKYSQLATDPRVKETLEEAYRVTWDACAIYASLLREPMPIKLTTMAPTGSVAKLPGVSEGIAPVKYRYFERRMRFSSHNKAQVEQLEEFKAKGYVIEPCVYDAHKLTSVVVMPTRDSILDECDESLVECSKDLSVKDYLDVQLLWQNAYVDNAISATIDLPEDYSSEALADDLRPYLPHLKGITAFPDISRPQSPYTPITKEQYEASLVKEVSDSVNEECANGSCPVR